MSVTVRIDRAGQVKKVLVPDEISLMLAGDVARGAALLDDGHPGWAEKIREEELQMSSGCRCILGQLYGSYSEVLYSGAPGSPGILGSNGRDGWMGRRGFVVDEGIEWDRVETDAREDTDEYLAALKVSEERHDALWLLLEDHWHDAIQARVSPVTPTLASSHAAAEGAV